VPHDIKGTAIFAFVVLQKEAEEMHAEEIVGALKEQVRNDISPIAVPEYVLTVPALPKTRSGKIMRRILSKIAVGEYTELGNVTTLQDPAVVDVIVEEHKKLSK
jgi:acetyl-CoA synthetase